VLVLNCVLNSALYLVLKLVLKLVLNFVLKPRQSFCELKIEVLGRTIIVMSEGIMLGDEFEYIGGELRQMVAC